MRAIKTVKQGIKGMFSQYAGLRRELYVLFWGKAATNMGAMIWPMLTLILSNKLGLEAKEIAAITISLGVIQFPVNLIGGKLADHCNKRNLIICCDLVTVVCYLLAACFPVSMHQIFLFFTASLFQTVENPSYDALVADLSSSKDRERAYSLIYLGLNLGLILAPTIGGMLFENHLNLAFVIDGLTTLSSTILIFLFIKDITPDKSNKSSVYEEAKEKNSTWSILWNQKIILLFFLAWAIYNFIYAQFNFLIPLNLEELYDARGAVYFGFLTSLNGLVVIIGTPLLTKYTKNLPDTSKLIAGTSLVTLGLSMYAFIQGLIPMYYVSMVLFTIGEILSTLGTYPYMTRRVPASHRGRISSVANIFIGAASYYSQWYIGNLLETQSMVTVWKIITSIGFVGILLYCVQRNIDKRTFPLLYKKAKNLQQADSVSEL